ncbi:hypothetical protein F5B22DRAFT_641878 [Xylaria bambusicola]|uniref:uncharacterized protein n=1 Tax=Xylaria bambusicola TaxID=326684 RepID=UPI002007DFE5|nr:uncharacterized protein F5B22DRAFT_641878 [Xylaria bambusicola]KAI0526735.1 hypothetical protein F5B22DRAFT_641878 [Xylaria bambusicola]
MAQNFVLQHTYPRHSEKCKTGSILWTLRQGRFNQNFDAAVVVLRYLYSMVHSDFRKDFEDPSTTVTQSILRYEISMFEYSVDSETGDEYTELFDDPAIIRVEYKHTTDSKPPATYRDLREIQVRPRRMKDEVKDGYG